MAAQFDLVVRNGTVLDGTGGPAREADVAVQDGRIAAVGRVAGAGREEIDAKGLAVTPGFVDIHTHYDGQATWDQRFVPSSGHGVTTVVMGNCGVGFAPCRPQDRDTLIKVMEGVEDIPELVMREGVPWNWQSFPDYLDALAQRRCDIDFATQVPHAPLRVFVMGRRGVDREPATTADMAAMAALVEEGLQAGALGFTTSRSLFHRTPDGALTPTITAGEEELAAIARGMRRAGKGVIQLLDDFQDATPEGSTEFAMLRRLVEISGRPLSFTLLDISLYPGRWKTLLEEVARANRDGLPIKGQVAARPVAILYGLELSFHPFSTCPSYRAIEGLPLEGKLERLRDPAMRARLLKEEPVYSNPNMLAFMRNVANMFVLGDPPNYTPPAAERLDARAAALGITPLELAYDLLVVGRRPHHPVPSRRQLHRLLRRQHGEHAAPREHRDGAGRRRRALRPDLRRELPHARADLLDARPQGRALAARLDGAPAHRGAGAHRRAGRSRPAGGGLQGRHQPDRP